MGQLTDQHCVTIDCKPIWGNDLDIEAVCNELIETTRIKGVVTQDAPSKPFLFATEPGESRLNALLRYLDPINCLSWMSPDGYLTVGRPNFSGPESGTLICNKEKRRSNVTHMSASRSATQVPSVIAGLYADSQKELVGLPKEQVFTNSNSRVQELKKRGHQIFRAITSSVPSGATPEDFRSLAELQVAGTPKTMLEYMAAREFARANANVLQVKAVVPGHFNDDGKPYMPDTLYAIDFDRGGVNEVMYCYGVEWSLSPTQGQTSVLSFCPVNTLVAGAKAL
jgi:prophage tail gpP-like protein